MRRAAALLFILAAADWALTVDGIALGLCREANPFVAGLLGLSVAGALAVKLATVAVGVLALALAGASRALWFCVCVYAVIVAYQSLARLAFV